MGDRCLWVGFDPAVGHSCLRDPLPELEGAEVSLWVCSVEGVNFDYYALSLLSFFGFSAFSSYGYFVDDSATGRVDLNGLIFAYHNTIVHLLVLIQIWMYPHGQNRLSCQAKLFILMIVAFLALYTWLTIVSRR